MSRFAQRIAVRGLTALALLVSAFFTTLGMPTPTRTAEAQTDTCSALSGVINDYWPGTNSPAAGTNAIQLGARRAGGRGLTINPGDMLLVIQVMGADINTSNTADYGDGPGGLTGSGFISNTNFVAGRYEYVQAVNSVGTSGGTLTIVGRGANFGLVNGYVNASATATTGPRQFQVVRVPQCASASLSGDVTGIAWNGATGGVLALDVTGLLSMNNRIINATGLGFRGGISNGDDPAFSVTYDFVTASHRDALKGEGFAGAPGGARSRGAPANAGGGGNDVNSGGGGGGNGSMGGRGGNSWADSAAEVGGLGGARAPATPARLFLGGGGGAGHANNQWC